MKKTVTREVTCCDNCGKEQDYPTRCLRCGKEVCWQCADKVGVKYEHGVYVSGSGDGWYCRPCDITLYERESDALYEGFRAVKALREEMQAWGADFQRRQKAAEAHLETLARRAGLY